MMSSRSSGEVPNDVPLIMQGYHAVESGNEQHGAKDARIVSVKPEVIDDSYERCSIAATGVSTTTTDALLGNQTQRFIWTMDSSKCSNDLIEKLVHQNEILLASNEASSLKLIAESKLSESNYNNSIALPTDKSSLFDVSISDSMPKSFPVGQAAIAKLSKTIGNQRSEQNVLQCKDHNIAGTLLRPKSPTRTCKIPNQDKDHFTHALMEVAHSETSSFNLSSHELFCAVSAPFSFRTRAGVLVSNLDMKHYWCNFCSFQTDEKGQILDHVVTHRFHCKYCTYQSFSRIDVIQHTGSVHDEFMETFKLMTFCALLPDFLQVEILQKKKRNGDDTDYASESKKARFSQAGRKPMSKASTDKKKFSNEDYEMFEMEVEEIETVSVKAEDMENGFIPSVDTLSNNKESQCVISNIMSGSDAVNSLLSKSSPQPNSVMTVAMENPVPMPSIMSPVPVNYVNAPQLPMLQVPGISQPQLAMFVNGPVSSDSKIVPMTYLTQAPMVQTPQLDTAMATSQTTPVPNLMMQNLAQPATPVSEPSSVSEDSQQAVSSNLMWTCGYCSFTAAQQSMLKAHLNTKHMGMTHKYVAVLVNNGDEQSSNNTDKIDSPQGHTPQAPAPQTPPPAPQTPPPVVQNEPADDESKDIGAVSNDEEVDEDHASANSSSDDNDESDQDYQPDSKQRSHTTRLQQYECQHCPYKSSMLRSVRKHIIDSHKRAPIVAIDLKATHLKRSKYVYFCVKDTCTYSTKSSDKYLRHVEVCTPFLPTDTSERSVSLQLTVKAASKGKMQSQDNGYACVYCNFRAGNILAVRLHITAIHNNEQIVIEDLRAVALKRKKYAYFCRTCTWEGRLRTHLNLHEAKEHGTSPPELPDDSSDIGEDTADDSSSTTSDKPVAKNKKRTRENSKEDTADDSSSTTSDKPVAKNKKRTRKNSKEDTADGSSSTTSDKPVAKNKKRTRKNSKEDTADDCSSTTSDKTVPKNAKRTNGKSKQVTSEEVVKNENQTSKAAPNLTSTGNATIKAQILCSAQSSSPRQFRCRQCHFTCVGIKLMRKHMAKNHVGCLLSTIDMQKENQRQSSTIFLCPQEECSFYNRFMETVETHALEEHDLTYKFPRPGGRVTTSVVQQPLPDNAPLTATSTTSGGNKYASAFECLYCRSSTITTSMQKMKEHILAEHKGEEIVMRDCVAWKLHKHSRLYMCSNVNCTYTTNDNMDYISHIGAHKGTLLRECKHCKHYEGTAELILAHLKEKHRDQAVIYNEVKFTFDKKGGICKKVTKVKVKDEKF